MQRFFIDGAASSDIWLLGEDARHFITVLRARPGDRAILCDCAGTDYECELIEIREGRALFRVIESRPSVGEPKVTVKVYPSVSKGERFEWMLQKLVELGTSEITPVISRRCIAAEPGERKLERWEKIIREAAQQSGRGAVPALKPAVPFPSAVDTAGGDKIICYENSAGLTLGAHCASRLPATVSLFTGPEGGYEDSEVASAAERGFVSVSLGSRILRCETAPVAALAIILSAAGEM